MTSWTDWITVWGSFCCAGCLSTTGSLKMRQPLSTGEWAGTSGTSFRKVGLVEFPAKGMWSLVFISTPPGDILTSVLPEGAHLSVFLPCTPNPTSGFFFYVPARAVVEVPLTTEQAAKIIMSAGLLQPETQGALAAMATAARQEPTDK